MQNMDFFKQTSNQTHTHTIKHKLTIIVIMFLSKKQH